MVLYAEKDCVKKPAKSILLEPACSRQELRFAKGGSVLHVWWKVR
jgi:hypothetical protein